ncbi:MAG: SRPBCC family protein [Acidobacteriota bacterium]
MATLRVETEVRAPIGEVFAVCADIAGAAGRVRNIRRIEILTPGGRSMLGMRWRETRDVLGREVSEELEMTAFEQDQSFTITSARHGTRFDVTFRFAPTAEGTKVTATLDIVPQTFGAILTAPFGVMLLSVLKKNLEEDLRDLKQAIEGTPVALA